MDFSFMLSIKNLKGKPARTLCLAAIAAFLSLSVFAGSLIVFSLNRGLASFEDRLGADIVAVPYKARTQGEFENILLQGIPGSFYMDAQSYQKILDIPGIEAASPQFYLASATASCCSSSVQIIGFDPETDFTVQPWILKSYGETPGDGDLIVGSGITVPKNRLLTFYGKELRVVSQLDETGTGLDSAVYTNMSTIRSLMESAQTLGFHSFDGLDPEDTVSSVLIKVSPEFQVSDVEDEINLRVRHVKASQALSMVSDIAAGLSGVSRMTSFLAVGIWFLSFVILLVSFAMITHERKKEFAMLRMIGASKGMVSKMLVTEGGIIGAVGALCGIVFGALVIFPFHSLIKDALALPYLLPDNFSICLFALAAFAFSFLLSAATGAFFAGRINKEDPGQLLRV
ncbi:MAG: FtsX-like permease family protein [Lachnospiraceae bacterium]|nr:FtsX-like permease family protein [Lachnospiraceae bacterium]